MECKDNSIPFPQRAAEHAARIVRRMTKAFQSVKEAWKNDIDHRSRAYSGEQGEIEKESLQALMSRAANLEAIDKNLARPSSSSTSGMNDDAEPMEIGMLNWRRNSGYGPPPRPNWYFPNRPTMPPPRRGFAGPQGYGGNRFIPTRRPWNIYGSGPGGYVSSPNGPPPPQGNNRGRFISPRHGSGPSGFGNES